MIIDRVYDSSINTKVIERAASLLDEGRLMAYPTDVNYAIGCHALRQASIDELCRLKGIDPRKQTLSVICHDLSQAASYARIDNTAFRILRANLPGPFTFILPTSTELPKVFKGRRSVGIRIPDSPVARAIAEAIGAPLLSMTATDSEGMPLGEADEVAVAYGDRSPIAMLIDAGSRRGDLTTVVDLTDSHSPEIIRQGAGQLI